MLACFNSCAVIHVCVRVCAVCHNVILCGVGRLRSIGLLGCWAIGLAQVLAVVPEAAVSDASGPEVEWGVLGGWTVARLVRVVRAGRLRGSEPVFF